MLALSTLLGAALLGETAPPPTWPLIEEDFEDGDLDGWTTVEPGNLQLTAGAAYAGSLGLEVTATAQPAYIVQQNINTTPEAYLSFAFDPNSVAIPENDVLYRPAKAIRIAAVKGPNGGEICTLLVWKPTDGPYKAFLRWTDETGTTQLDYPEGELDLADGWQQITIGHRIDEWIRLWVDGDLMREIPGQHLQEYGSHVLVGLLDIGNQTTPLGSIRFDEVRYGLPSIDDLWVDASNGDDSNDGLSSAHPMATIQCAAEWAGPGTVVHVQPGVYRESVRPAHGGGDGNPVVYVDESGTGAAVLRGSEPSSGLTWTQLSSNTIGLPPSVDPTNVYWTDLGSFELAQDPRFVMYRQTSEDPYERFPVSREPDWTVTHEWKNHELWWSADGGSGPAGCYPPTDPDPVDCDAPSRSSTQLTDATTDAEPAGVESGNLSTLDDIVGATLVAMDTVQGHDLLRSTVVGHEPAIGRITVNPDASYHDGTSGLGWGTKYYLEGRPGFIDSEGEWWFDTDTALLYLYSPGGVDPATLDIEIAVRSDGFDLSDRSFTHLDGLSIEMWNGNAILQSNYLGKSSYGNEVRNVTLRYANRGVHLTQNAAGDPEAITDGFVLEDSEISHMDTHALYTYYGWNGDNDPAQFTHPGIVNTIVRGNELHHLGFRSDNPYAVGLSMMFPDSLHFEDNHVHHVAHNGMQLNRSVIQSGLTYDFPPEDIKTGEVLISSNVFEKACHNSADCAALKIWGKAPDSHVFRDFLIVGNVFKNTFGWSWISEKRGLWTVGSQVGRGGFGLYLGHTAGFHIYRNIAYNVAQGGFKFAGEWRDGDQICYDNLLARSSYGFRLDGPDEDTHGSVNTQLFNNIMTNIEGYGVVLWDVDGQFGNLSIDRNLYFEIGWNDWFHRGGAMSVWGVEPVQYYETVADIQASTPWEDNGLEADPLFVDYDPTVHLAPDPESTTWPDFQLTGDSPAIDSGTETLPTSLQDLLTLFGIDETRIGPRWDVGRFEYLGTGNADLRLDQTDTIDPVAVDDVFAYAITASNDGPEWVDGVIVTNTLPSETVFDSADSESGSCSHSSGTVTCDVGAMNIGETVDITVWIAATAAGTASNTASVSGDGTDPAPGNDSSTEATRILDPLSCDPNGSGAPDATDLDTTVQAIYDGSPLASDCSGDDVTDAEDLAALILLIKR